MSTVQVRASESKEEVLPETSFEELEECIPLETAFDKLHDNARNYYATKVS